MGSRQLLIFHKIKRKENKSYKNGVCSQGVKNWRLPEKQAFMIFKF